MKRKRVCNDDDNKELPKRKKRKKRKKEVSGLELFTHKKVLKQFEKFLSTLDSTIVSLGSERFDKDSDSFGLRIFRNDVYNSLARKFIDKFREFEMYNFNKDDQDMFKVWIGLYLENEKLNTEVGDKIGKLQLILDDLKKKKQMIIKIKQKLNKEK